MDTHILQSKQKLQRQETDPGAKQVVAFARFLL